MKRNVGCIFFFTWKIDAAFHLSHKNRVIMMPIAVNETSDCKLLFVFFSILFLWMKSDVSWRCGRKNDQSNVNTAMNHINKHLFYLYLRDKCGALQGFDIQFFFLVLFLMAVFEFRRNSGKYDVLEVLSKADHFF